eukprot:349917-Chlamydomonas_euryale.AAC.2
MQCMQLIARAGVSLRHACGVEQQLSRRRRLLGSLTQSGTHRSAGVGECAQLGVRVWPLQPGLGALVRAGSQPCPNCTPLIPGIGKGGEGDLGWKHSAEKWLAWDVRALAASSHPPHWCASAAKFRCAPRLPSAQQRPYVDRLHA